jgi:hypothetical protein
MSNRLHLVPRRQAQESKAAEGFLDETIEFWQARSPRNLSREDARQITENLTGFFQILERWDDANHASEMDRHGEKRAA